ncbi:MAG: hypothetical protein DHS20C05_18410 [Hyphococcus sp.]|nr:MAG: hypothetical protein DHS20C05_18410 [Marinicaulis sp.]
MTQADDQNQFAGRIEGGIDAIVVGSDAEALAASAYLGGAGLKTLLLCDTVEIGGSIKAGEFPSGLAYTEGEHLLSVLDPAMIADLDLYRFGLKYAARRLDTVYFFKDDETLLLSGDIRQAAQPLEQDVAQPLETFLKDLMEAAVLLRPVFEPVRNRSGFNEKQSSAFGSEVTGKLDLFSVASIDDVLDEYFPDSAVKTAMLSEAAFRSGAAPHEAFSFMGFVRQKAGEISGLPGAVAYPQGGALAVITALRRAAQAAKVDIRAATPVSSILIERDQVAGVELENGGQLRAPLVIASGEARHVFVDMIGPRNIDIEFQRLLAKPAPQMMTVQMKLALKGVARDEQTKAHMRKRLVFAPPADSLRRAFNDARAGAIPDTFIIEAIFPNALDEESALENRHLLSVMAHPLPYEADPSPERRQEIETAILKTIEAFAPEVCERIEEKTLLLPGAHAGSTKSKPALLQQIAHGRRLASAGHVSGLYYCGEGAQIGFGLSGAAGRIAGKAALRDYKRGTVA